MTTILVDGPAGAGKVALVDTLMECIPYAKLRQFNGDERAQEFMAALKEDTREFSAPSIAIWHRSWVSAWVADKLKGEDADSLDNLLRETQGLGIILLGDEDVVDEDQRVLFEEYIDGESNENWFIVEEDESEELVARIRKRILSV